jgi:hypothetical protein
MGIYFGKDVDDRIIEFNALTGSENIKIRNKIFEDGIRPAFTRLIESQMYLYKFYKVDDPDTLKYECLSTLYEILPKFDASKGKKAFSYFNVVVKNWFIGKTRERKKRLKTETENFYSIDHEIVKNDPSIVLTSYEAEIIEKEFLKTLFTRMDDWRKLLKRKQEHQVLDAIEFLLQNPHLITIFNKKAVFLYIKEMTGLTAKQVNHNMMNIRLMYEQFREKFNAGEEV